MTIAKLYSIKTLKQHYNTLINSGISTEQVEAIIKAIKYAKKVQNSNFATTHDIQILRYEIEKLEMRLIIKLGALMAFWSSMIIAVIKLNN
jgi:hypothetical protein